MKVWPRPAESSRALVLGRRPSGSDTWLRGGDADPLLSGEVDVLVLSPLGSRLQVGAGANRQLVGEDVVVTAEPGADDVAEVVDDARVRRDEGPRGTVHRNARRDGRC